MTKYRKISNFFEDIFSKYKCGFCKGYDAQYHLIVMIEKWKKIVGYGGVTFGAHRALDLFIAKLEAHGFQTDALNPVYDYLPSRKQRVKNR